MSNAALAGLERTVAACLLCARALAARDPRSPRSLCVVIAMLEAAHDELVKPAAARLAA